MAIKVTPGNIDDRMPLKQGMAELRRNMKEQELETIDEGLLNQRSLIETVFDELKTCARLNIQDVVVCQALQLIY